MLCAITAAARKPASILHRMWVDGSEFNPAAGTVVTPVMRATPLAEVGFDREVKEAMERRRQCFVDMGHVARLPDGAVRAPRDILQRLEQAEVARVARAMAAESGLSFIPTKPGDHVSGRLAGAVNLASGRFAMIDNGLGFQLVPWQPVLDKRIGQHITGLAREGGRIEWSFGRKRGLGMGI